MHPPTELSRIWTIGHSTRSMVEFVDLLQQNAIVAVADVRLLPGSKRYPHFDREALARSLGEHGIRYEHFPELGGRRKPQADSPHTAWRNDAFRGYADYMDTPEFAAGSARLLEFGSIHGLTAMMCAEAVWWSCHRSLVSDYLQVRGTEVLHIMGEGKTQPHPFTSAATVVNGMLSYVAPQATFPNI